PARSHGADPVERNPEPVRAEGSQANHRLSDQLRKAGSLGRIVHRPRSDAARDGAGDGPRAFAQAAILTRPRNSVAVGVDEAPRFFCPHAGVVDADPRGGLDLRARLAAVLDPQRAVDAEIELIVRARDRERATEL